MFIRNYIGRSELPQVVSYFIITFRGTDSNRLVPGKVGAIGFTLLGTQPEMAAHATSLSAAWPLQV